MRLGRVPGGEGERLAEGVLRLVAELLRRNVDRGDLVQVGLGFQNKKRERRSILRPFEEKEQSKIGRGGEERKGPGAKRRSYERVREK